MTFFPDAEVGEVHIKVLAVVYFVDGEDRDVRDVIVHPGHPAT